MLHFSMTVYTINAFNTISSHTYIGMWHGKTTFAPCGKIYKSATHLTGGRTLHPRNKCYLVSFHSLNRFISNRPNTSTSKWATHNREINILVTTIWKWVEIIFCDSIKRQSQFILKMEMDSHFGKVKTSQCTYPTTYCYYHCSLPQFVKCHSDWVEHRWILRKAPWCMTDVELFTGI